MAEIINFKNIGFKNRQIDVFIRTLRFKLSELCCEKDIILGIVDTYCRSLRDQMKSDDSVSHSTWQYISSSENLDMAVAKFVETIKNEDRFNF